MKVMIAYDGSTYADAAIDDLPRAGLPHDSEVLVTTVVDFSASRPSVSEFDLVSAASRRLDTVLAQVRQHDAQALKDARAMASKAAHGLRPHFPEWKIRFDVLRGTPAEELLQKVASWKPDLIIGGSQGRSTIGRFFLGSVSKRVAEEARCSVRVVRSQFNRTEAEPLDLMIGAANPAEATRIVDAVRKRVWPPGSRFRIVAIDNSVTTDRILRVEGDESSIYEKAAEPLTAAGLQVSIQIETGDPKTIWLQAAEGSRVDAIFVAGNNKNEPLDGPALGLITDAKCTVEIVREFG